MNRFDDLLRTGGALAGRIGDAALAAVADARSPRPGDEIGPFRIVREIGRGGMAVVFLAERADGQFQQVVALKWIHALAASAATRELFRRERQILADLAHPHIARLIDGGETVDGQLWFAMPWIEGEAIDAWCANQRCDLRARARLLLQVAAALRFAHARLLVHCDVKASNILVDREGLVHLLDFGVARLAGPREGAPATGHTPAVASPEQRAGLAVGVASDIHQLGLLAAQLFGATVTETATDAVRIDGQDRRFEWPAHVPPELRAIVARATRFEPAERYESMAGLADDLQAWLARRPVAAYRSGAAYTLRCFLRRNPAVSVVAMLSIVLLLGISAAFTWRLALERDQARAAASRAEAVSGFLVRLFRDVDPASNRIAADAARSLVQRGESALADGLAGTPDVRAAVLATLAEVNQSLGDFAAAERLARESLAADPAAPAGALALRRAALAQALASRGAYDRALATVEAALDALEALGRAGDDTAGRIRLLSVQANAAQLKGDLTLARSSASALLAEPITGEATLEARAMAYLVLAYVAEQGGDFDAALTEADSAVQPLAQALGREHPRLAALEAYRAYLLLGVGRHAEAEGAADAAVARLTEVYGGAHARLSYALTNQALARLRVGKPALARETGERALAMCRAQLSADHAQCAVSAQVLSTIAEAQGDEAATLALLQEVLRVRRATLRPDHAYIGFAELQLAGALCRSGDAPGARSHLAEADRILAGAPVGVPEARRRDEIRARCG